ncbi:AMP-dependent synthetase and ligase [Caldalkalibacillus thermarum TA2.A1]|uniref:AMP-dependent synthetase and ligase n=1 Tax=Caldalkalibacillus thermarum (strain TA2.A1) TaxID=986075 RepID=F5L7J0_CALTT|nr:class I adenylate-forming enzyme family protein [Caldalkalibacillus thermarum]EGL82704.1 AMP-dependent synthetase and ligase [Caldalkalibacillus thermarum TA2.A1]QZT33753.1 acyl--CoA ligase [Caldalkalibacillus thermarum TA2.A1]
MNLSQLLSISARKYPNKEAMVFNHQRLTYREWNDKVDCLAWYLQEKGLQPGQCMVIMAPNTPEFACLYYAVIRAEGIVVPVNPRLSKEEVLYIIKDCDAYGIFVHEVLLPQFQDLPQKAIDVHCFTSAGPSTELPKSWENIHHCLEQVTDINLKEPELMEDNTVSILYTSGTTGRPKGVIFSHRNILTVTQMINIELGINLDSRVLHLMPLSHSAPLHLFFVAATNVGATHILAPTFTPELLLQLVQQEKVTHFFGAPVAYLLTAKHPDFSQYDLSSVKYWIYGGAPLSADKCRLLEQFYGRDRLCCVYGLTEAGPSGTLLFHASEGHKAGSIGKRGAWSVEVEIVNDQGQRVAPGEVGEIRIRGEVNMQGYLNNEEATQETLKGGWIYTGDLAHYDDDGYMWVMDRKKDLIISGGQNIYPKEIEQHLEQHPKIKDVAVVGVAHPEWGETVKAFIVPQGSGEDEPSDWLSEIKSYLQEKIAEYKIPRLCEVIDEIPRNPTGKVLKHVLKSRGQQKTQV